MSKDPAHPRPRADGPPLPTLPPDFGPTPVPKSSHQLPPRPPAPPASSRLRDEAGSRLRDEESPSRSVPGGLDPVLLLLAALGGGLAAVLVVGMLLLGMMLT